ncbi:hypothetical protein [Deinococcus peraridilitoris]|uniref:Lipopolysaccharide assembly protein A domain-containing protein n=1 Tax=Deinococcus peraridilitoris (strain DSM 19664 / LMG 22246 / CIP 109416 / KR-200) TaxID=937777 RepID=K9ZZM5_DEIPD|nr:hypothetical protein [Deinococcus peraridilitoris]AFZ66210.1 Protein of unknown function (DUF1049) [Deinococcus peraridilitoris DSM 19664]
MKLNTVVLIVVLALLIVFAVFNFDALMYPHTLNLFGAASYTVPLGMIVLVIGALIALLFSLLTSYADLRSRAAEARTLREMENLRQSLDQQESSRFSQLQAYLSERFAALEQGGSRGQSELGPQLAARMDRLRDELSADLGQIDDYLRRRLGDLPPEDRPGRF